MQQSMQTQELEFRRQCLDYDKERMFVMGRFKSEILQVKVKISSATIKIIEIRSKSHFFKNAIS